MSGKEPDYYEYMDAEDRVCRLDGGAHVMEAAEQLITLTIKGKKLSKTISVWKCRKCGFWIGQNAW